MTWVRNGKPAIETVGLAGKPCFWIWVAASLSAKALAPKSRATRSASTTTIQMMALRPARRFGAWYWYTPPRLLLVARSRCRGQDFASEQGLLDLAQVE